MNVVLPSYIPGHATERTISMIANYLVCLS